jgi:hypothetical protein
MLAEEMIDNTIDQDERLWTRSSCKCNEPEDEEGFSSCRPETLIIYDGALSVDLIDSLSVTQTKIDFSKPGCWLLSNFCFTCNVVSAVLFIFTNSTKLEDCQKMIIKYKLLLCQF